MAVSTGAKSVTAVQSNFSTTTLPQFYTALDSFSDASGDLKSVLASLSPTLKETEGVLSQLDGTLEQAESDTTAEEIWREMRHQPIHLLRLAQEARRA